jgi:hypothetical protein
MKPLINEFRFYQKTQRSILGQKSELQRAIERRQKVIRQQEMEELNQEINQQHQHNHGNNQNQYDQSQQQQLSSQQEGRENRSFDQTLLNMRQMLKISTGNHKNNETSSFNTSATNVNNSRSNDQTRTDDQRSSIEAQYSVVNKIRPQPVQRRSTMRDLSSNNSSNSLVLSVAANTSSKNSTNLKANASSSSISSLISTSAASSSSSSTGMILSEARKIQLQPHVSQESKHNEFKSDNGPLNSKRLDVHLNSNDGEGEGKRVSQVKLILSSLEQQTQQQKQQFIKHNRVGPQGTHYRHQLIPSTIHSNLIHDRILHQNNNNSTYDQEESSSSSSSSSLVVHHHFHHPKLEYNNKNQSQNNHLRLLNTSNNNNSYHQRIPASLFPPSKR